MNRIIASALCAFFVLAPCLAHAQASSAPLVAPCVTAIPSPSNPNAIPYCAPVTSSNPLPTTGGGGGGGAITAPLGPTTAPAAAVATTSSDNVNVTPTDCSISASGTAQNIIAAATTRHGATIANIDPTTGAGEAVWISFTGTATAGTAGSFPLAPPAVTTLAGMGSWTSPPGFGFNHAISVVATSGHKISCTVW